MLNLKKYILLYFVFSLINQSLAEEISEDPFIISGIEVYYEDMTPDDAKVDADEAAIAKSFESLLSRLLTKTNLGRISSLKTKDYALCAVDSSQTNERITSSSYYATYTIKFDSLCIRKLLNKKGVYFTESYAPITLIVPILQKDDKSIIWSDDDWKAASDILPADMGLSRFLYLKGDIIDVSILGKQTPPKLDDTTIAQLLKRYGSDSISTIRVTPKSDAWDISITNTLKYNAFVPIFSGSFKPNLKDAKPAEQYNEALLFALGRIDAHYKRADLVE